MIEADLRRVRRARRPMRAVASLAGVIAAVLAPGAEAIGAVPSDRFTKFAAPSRMASPPGVEPRAPAAAPARPAAGTLEVLSSPDGPELTLTLSRPAPAAAFRYGNHVWIVVATTETVTRAPARPSAVRLFAGLEIIRLADAVALRLPHRTGHRMVARRTRATWSFVYARADLDGTAPEARLEPALVSATLETTVVSVTDSRLTTVHRLVDPVVGTTLIVATSAEPGIAVRSVYRAPAFRLLPTRLGLAVEVRADGVEVERRETGIRVLYRRPSAPPGRP